MRCPGCGSSNEPDAKFCASCGAQLIAAQSPSGGVSQDTCPHCGLPTRVGDRFCEHCGSPVDRQPAGPPDVAESAGASKVACPRCHAPNSTASRFCESCGASLKAPVPPSPVPTSAAAPQGVSIQLASALRARDRARKHAGSDDELAAAESEVRRAKALVHQKLEETSAELDGLRREMNAHVTRQQAGDYTEAQFRNATADPRRRIASLERLQESFSALLGAETEAELVGPRKAAPTLGLATPGSIKEAARSEVSNVKRDVAAVRQEVPLARKQTQGETRDARAVSTEAPRVADGEKGGGRPPKRGAYSGRATKTGGIPAPRWMLIGSGVVIAAAAVAFVVMAIQAFAGPISLPSLSLPFGGGDGSGNSATPPSTAAPVTTAAPAGAEFQVPVQLRGAQGVGSLYVELFYDPAALEIVQLDYAAMPSGTLTDYELGPGTVSIGVVSSTGLSGDWVVAFITCRRAAGAPMSGDTTIGVSQVLAHRATDLSEVLANGSNGHVNLSTLAVAAPTMTFG